MLRGLCSTRLPVQCVQLLSQNTIDQRKTEQRGGALDREEGASHREGPDYLGRGQLHILPGFKA